MPDGKKLSDQAYNNLQRSLDEFRAGGERDGGVLLLEEGLTWDTISLSPIDLQRTEAQKLSRAEICMFFGVPPSIIGHNRRSAQNWGPGLVQRTDGSGAISVETHRHSVGR